MQIQTLKKISAFLLSGFLLFTGCTKPDESPLSKTELISTSPWKFSQAGIDQNNDGAIDLPLPDGTLEACATDNLLTFNEDSTGVIDEGATKCDPSDPQTLPFTWKFVDEESAIEFSQSVIPGLEGQAELVTLNETTLSLSQNADIPGVPFKLTVIVELVH